MSPSVRYAYVSRSLLSVMGLFHRALLARRPDGKGLLRGKPAPSGLLVDRALDSVFFISITDLPRGVLSGPTGLFVPSAGAAGEVSPASCCHKHTHMHTHTHTHTHTYAHTYTYTYIQSAHVVCWGGMHTCQ